MEASPSSPPPSPSSEEVTPGEETPPIEEMTFVEKIKPLAGEITEFIQDHRDDAAQEERWRTTMKRDMGKRFTKLEKKMQSQGKEMQGREGNAHEGDMGKSLQAVHQRLEEVHSKVDKKLDRIVQDLARLTAV